MARRALMAVLVIVAACCTFGGQAFAASPTPQAYKYLVDGQCSIFSDGKDTLTLSGTTVASQTVSRITVDVSLEYWNGVQWVTLKTAVFTDTNTWRVSGTWAVKATPGYWYRAYCRHTVYHAGTLESGISITSAITL